MLDKQLQDPEEDQDEENSGSSRNSRSSSSSVSRIASPDYNDDALDLNNVGQFGAERTTHIEQTTPIMSSHNNMDIDEVKEVKLYDEEEPLTIPQSTHSFLFTEDINSMPFLFSVGIAGICCTCLLLALINNLQNGQVPANVDVSVKIAQYMSILIALLMEEEIPTGLYLLRRISKAYFESKFPDLQYYRFVMSSILRITIGYLFLLNVIIILRQANVVIEIFYDVLALQFIQQLDDIAFAISKIDVLGKKLQRATMTSYFRVDFQKQTDGSARRTILNKVKSRKWRMKVFLKGIYFINLLGFLAAMISVSVRQSDGYYQCSSITVRLGRDEVWDAAVVEWQRIIPGSVVTEEMVLVYSYFNGVYVKDDNRLSEGRPIYVERKKTAGSQPFDGPSPLNVGWNLTFNAIEPAEIRYCDGHWIFTHEYIRKSRRSHLDDSDCNWLLRSPATDEFDLLDVDGKWQLWSGDISETEVNFICDECQDNSDCNLNGICNSDGECECFVEDEVVFLGTHCEVTVKDECRTIIGEVWGDVWSLDVNTTYENYGDIFQTYGRPVYTYVGGVPEEMFKQREGDEYTLMYSGSRWFNVRLEGARTPIETPSWKWLTSNYHPFWMTAYTPETTSTVSDPTTNDSPVGVDFYWVGKQGNQYGPFGVLDPLQNQTGRGYFRCKGYDKDQCTFCPNGMQNGSFVIPDGDGTTCGEMPNIASAYKNGTLECNSWLQPIQQVCCPSGEIQDEDAVDGVATNGTCSFCYNKTVDKDEVISALQTTCGERANYAATLHSNSSLCQEILDSAEDMCCLP